MPWVDIDWLINENGRLESETRKLKAEIEWYELNKTQLENLCDKLIKENDELKAIVKELLTPAMLGAAEHDIDINDCLKRIEKMLGVRKDG